MPLSWYHSSKYPFLASIKKLNGLVSGKSKPLHVGELKLQQLQNERFTDYANLLQAFIAQFSELKFDQQSMGSILTKSSNLVTTLNASRIPFNNSFCICQWQNLLLHPSWKSLYRITLSQDYAILKHLKAIITQQSIASDRSNFGRSS